MRAPSEVAAQLAAGDDYPPPTRGRVVVWGELGAHPIPGRTWQVLHHVVGLRRLGFDVWYVEQSDGLLLAPRTHDYSEDYRPNVEYLVRLMDRVGLGDRWIFNPPQTDRWFGGSEAQLRRLYKEADAALNLCGVQEVWPEHSDIGCTIYLQTDPVAFQINASRGDPKSIEQLHAHHHLFTYGENIGSPRCPVPTAGRRWHPTRPPVCLDWWETTGSPSQEAPLTTVTQWAQSHNDVEWNGDTYSWSKDREFRRVIGLPARSRLPIELAVSGIDAAGAGEVRRHGWRIVDAADIADPDSYRDYIRSSRGEFTVAKDQNVRLRSGWFSDRSACYLAAGRPVVMQDTGFSDILPTGKGLFAFSTEDEAAAAIEEIAGDYDGHAAAAREIAQEFFDARRVLHDVLSKAGLM